MTTVLIVFGIIMTYLFVGGAFGGFLYSSPRWTSDGSFFCGLVWPASIPILSGRLIGGWFGDRESRREKRTEREDEKHRQRMAELQAERQSNEAALAVLRAEGVKV